MRLTAAFLLAFCCIAADSLPVTPAESLSGKKLDFPSALKGIPAVCVFGFSKESGDRTKLWMTKLNDQGIKAWSIADLEGAPAMVRGMIRSSMKKGTPQPLLDRSLVITKDEKAWKIALGVMQVSLPTVILLDPNGHLVWTHEGLYADETARDLKTRLNSVP